MSEGGLRCVTAVLVEGLSTRAPAQEVMLKSFNTSADYSPRCPPTRIVASRVTPQTP